MSIKYVEYLEADGNSYFELPAGTITWNNNSGIEVQYYHNAYVDNSYLIGAYGLNGNTSIYTYYEQLGILMFEQRFGKSWYTNEYKPEIQPYAHTIKIDKNGRTFDGVTESITWSEPESWTFERINLSPVRIFGRGSNQGDNYRYVALQGTRIYYVKIYDGDEVVHYFRPCLKGNTPCIYDEISQTFYYNQGTGTFGYGKALNTLHLFANNNEGTAEDLGYYRLYNMEIEGDSEGVESGVDYVDCLIGDGASYIDTGMAIPSGYKVEVTFMSTVQKAEYISNDWCAIFGCSNAIGFAYDTTPYGISVGLYSTNIAIKNNGQANLQYANIKDTCYNKKYILSLVAGENNTNPGNILVFANNTLKQSGQINPYPFAHNYLKIYDFKIYNAQGDLIQYLRPCLDTEGVPCMYDEVSKQYFYNQGSGTFGYKKKLRDFQPVLDSNGIPTLMDKVNKKYYYDKNGKGFRYEESYKPVSYLEGDGNSWIDTGILGNLQYKYEMIVEDNTTDSYENFFGSHIGANDLCICRRIEGKEINFGYNGTIFAGFALPTSKSTIYIDKNKLYINNSLVKTATETTQTTCHNTISIYTIRNGSTINSMSNIKVYSFKIWNENSELILDLIPVLDKNNTPCMYDKVSKQFFYNQGDGEFSYGIEEDECPPVNYVEYLETDGNCIIPTRIIEGVTTDLVVEAKMKLSVDNSTYYVFGTMGAYTMSKTGIVKTNDRKLQFIYLQRNSTKVDFTNTDVHTFKIDKNGGYIDGELKCDLSSGESNFNTNNFADSPFYLFGNYYTTAYKYDYAISGTRIYYVTLSQNGEVLADFRPCLDDNGTPCIYDAVTGEYYYNSYIGTFSCGKTPYTPIKYIETNGTQYIDTGVVPTDNTDIDMVARACEPIITGDTGQVEYLQGDRNSWIDTGIKANVKYKYEVVMQDDSTNNYGAIFGTDNNCTVFKNGETGLKFTYSQNHLYGSNYSLNEKTTITVDEHNLLVNGSTAITHSSAYLTSNFSKNTIIFASSNGTFTPCSSKIYSFKMWDNNGNLVFDGVPYVNNGVPCMYNVVTDEYLYNQGSGTFSYGELVASSSFKNYLMNDFYVDTTYKYKETDTTVEPNLTASEGATLTLGSTYMAYLSEEELEQATKNGWIIE